MRSGGIVQGLLDAIQADMIEQDRHKLTRATLLSAPTAAPPTFSSTIFLIACRACAFSFDELVLG